MEKQWKQCLRKLQKIVKDREVSSVAIHLISKSQTWLCNWIIPMRTEAPVKPLALVVVEKDFGVRLGFPFSCAFPWIQGKEHKILIVLPNIAFKKKLKNKITIFCRSERFDWVCALDFTEGCGRKLEWAESAKNRWPAAGGWGMW